MKNHGKHQSRGQAALENLIMVGFALAFILPLSFLFMSSTGSENSKTTIAQSKATARAIAEEAGELYLQGEGAKKTVLVNYPEGVTDSRISGNVVVLSVSPEPGRQLDIVSQTFAEIRAGESFAGKRNAGLQRISLESKSDPLTGELYVEIGYE